MPLPGVIQRGLMSGLPTTRLAFNGGHLMGYLGDVDIAGWPAGTQIQYHNKPLYTNTWFTYSPIDIKNAFAASGIFIPSTVSVALSEGDNAIEVWAGATTVDISGVIPVAVNTADLKKAIEDLLANWFYPSPNTAVYSPPPTISQTISNTGSVVSTNPGASVNAGAGPAFINTGQSEYVEVTDPTVYGIQYVIANYSDEYSDYDVIFTDGSSGVFDSSGDYQGGTKGQIRRLDLWDDDYGNVIGSVATLNDLTELYFDMSGNFQEGFAPPGSTVSTVTHANPLSTVNAVTPDAIAAAINKALGTGTPGKPGTGIDSTKILNSLGLGGLPLALGVGAGTLLIGGGFLLYLLVSGTLAGKGRR